LAATAGCPTGLITQSTSDWLILFEPTLSIVDGAKVKRLADGCQCRFSVQTSNVVPHFYDWRNPFRLRALLYVKISTTMFYTELSTVICPDVASKQGAQTVTIRVMGQATEAVTNDWYFPGD
jgi:hypothetical protein